MYRQTCKRNVLDFLQKVKGMTEANARAFVQSHLVLAVQNVCYEDSDEVRSVECTFNLTCDVTNDEGVKEPKTLFGSYNYHLRERWSEVEHFATAKCDACNLFRATSKKGTFQLTKAGASAIHSVFGAGWTKWEAGVSRFDVIAVLCKDHSACVYSTSPSTRATKSGYLIDGRYRLYLSISSCMHAHDRHWVA
jgi:hypothetical protein